MQNQLDPTLVMTKTELVKTFLDVSGICESNSEQTVS